jgi:hypothetical protein
MKSPGIAAIILAASLAALPALAYSGKWHVVENLRSQTCYRVTRFTPTKGWHDFGRFNTFRQAGFFIWSHRSICRYSPVFD